MEIKFIQPLYFECHCGRFNCIKPPNMHEGSGCGVANQPCDNPECKNIFSLDFGIEEADND